MAIDTTLRVSGVDYDRAARLAARIHLTRLSRELSGFDELAFVVVGGAPDPAFDHGVAVQLDVDYGAGPLTKFTGVITDLTWGIGPHGWVQAYNCSGLKYLTERVPVTAPDGTGEYVLNRAPDDPYYAASDAGLTLGQIVTRALKVEATAVALAAVGVQYASLGPATLHATTVADLAHLTVVPPQPVSLSGEGFFATLDSLIERWMPKYVLEIAPDGLVRVKDTTDTTVFVPRTLTLASAFGVGDLGVPWPSIRSSTDRCATRLVMRGGPICAVALLSTADGTLTKAWTTPDQTAWTLLDYTQPKDGKDAGTVSAVTGNTATCTSSDATKAVALNFWPGREAVIYLLDAVAAGLDLTEYRRITANTALSTGGSYTITWDASQALDHNSYTKYRVVAQAGSKADVSRLYWITEPLSGHTGLNTYIGSHLVVRSPIPIPWANNSKSVEIFYATALVVGGGVATEVPIGVEVLPSTGQIRLTQPAVTAHGQPSRLNLGYPTNANDGLPTDVQVLVIYSRGDHMAVVPPDVSGVPQYEGTAHTAQGLEVTRYIDVPSYADQWDALGMAALAQQHLDAIKDTVYDGTGEFFGDPGFDFLDFTYSLNYAIDGTTGPWDSINAPVRGVTLEWPSAAGYQHKVTFQFSTRRRPFSGDDLYLHPSFTGGSILNSFSSEQSMMQGPSSPGFVVDDVAQGGQIMKSLQSRQSEANRFDMPAGQDQGSFTPQDLGITGRGNNFRSTGQNRPDAINPANQVQPETPREARLRRENNPPAPALASRDEALDQDAIRRAGIEQDWERRHRNDEPQPPREPLPSRDEALAQDAARREKINEDWKARHPGDDMAGGGG